MVTKNEAFDSKALERLVIHAVETDELDKFADQIIERALEERQVIAPRKNSSTYRLLREAIASSRFPLEAGKVADFVVRELSLIREEIGVRAMVERYATLNEVPRGRFTSRVKQSMIAYLRELGIQQVSPAAFERGDYDEYLALAYANSIRTAGGSADPIVAARLKSTGPGWDYRVKFFDGIESRSVLPGNILAAAALDYSWYLGEMLGVYALAERVGDLWDNGVIDIESDDVQSMIFNYRENAMQRPTPEQRGSIYKRVLNLGNTKVMSGVIVNEEFPHLWHQLMSEVARYIEKREDAHEGSRVSVRPIVHAIQELQYNLTEFGGGGTAKQAQKLNAQLEDAMAILGAPEVVEQLAFGRRKSVWRVIERLAREERGRSVDVNAVKILAEEGNRCFQFIADYTPEVTSQDAAFDAFIDSAEAWILAEASLAGGDRKGAKEEEEEDEEADEEEMVTEPDDDDTAWE
jgi:hypothetical protein